MRTGVLEKSITVHPRLRGELFLITWDYLLVLRFIPAYAGNSKKVAHRAFLEPVHPRLRGELFFVDEVLPGDTGSSPLTRGTRVLGPVGPIENAVHPRLRGELT